MNQPKSAQSLAQRSINTALWTILGFGLTQFIRLSNNLLLTRFLAPEHFGVISIVTVYLIGLAMFSDLGIGTSIIQSDKSKDVKFLNTAWTLQVGRGVLLWMFCVITAWPLAYFYHQPILIYVIPVSGLTALISGFNSTTNFTRNRDLNIKRVVINEVSAQLSSLLLMLALAYYYPSVWVLVAGSIWASLFSLFASHRLDVSFKNRFHWDKTSAQTLIHFGKWVFLSTICGFFVNSGGTLILGKFLPIATLGLFAIGLNLAKVVELVFNQINSRVVMPVFVNLKHTSNQELRKKVIKIRVAIMAAFLPPLLIMVLFGEQITYVLFDSRYQGAAWILQLFALSYIPLIVAGLGGFYYALGDSLNGLKISFIKMLFYFACIIVGWELNGSTGMIEGIAFSNIIHYVMDTWAQIKYKIWVPTIDVVAFSFALMVLFGL